MRQILENVARVNGKLDVLGLDFSGQRTEVDGLPVGSSPPSYNLSGTTAVLCGTTLFRKHQANIIVYRPRNGNGREESASDVARKWGPAPKGIAICFPVCLCHVVVQKIAG